MTWISKIIAGTAAIPLLLAPLVPTAAFATDALGDPVLNMQFENAVTDSADTTRATSISGTNFSYVDGVTSGTKALNFGGSTVVKLGTGTDLQPAAFTYSTWVKPSAAIADSSEQFFAWMKNAWNSAGWYVGMTASQSLVISIGTAPLEVSVPQTTTAKSALYPVGEWTNIVVTFDGTAVKAYRNGVPLALTVNRAAASPSVGGGTTSVKQLGNNGPSYNGSYLTNVALDEVKLWSKAGTASDVVAEYRKIVPGFDPATVAQSDLQAVSLASSFTTDQQLTATGASGSTISWTSSDDSVVGVDATGYATVTRPAAGSADASVTLTATASYAGSDPKTRQFAVTVPAKTDSASAATLVQEAGMQNVEVLDSYLTNAAEKDIAYLLSFDTGRLLYEFRRVSGVTQTASGNYGGWEAGPTKNGDTSVSNPSRFTGHFVGHYLSAVAEAYASTTATTAQKAQLLQKLEEMVIGLRATQTAFAQANPSSAGFLPAFEVSALPSGANGLLVPFYNLHKVLQGLIEAYRDVPTDLVYEGQNVKQTALSAASDFGTFLTTWFASSGKTKAQILATEYGGMNDALYQLYAITENPKHKQAAELFDETSLFESLANGQDVLNGKHANTTIPKLIGALQRYVTFTENPDLYATLTQAEKDALPTYLSAAKNFWQIVIDDHTYANGGNSQSEHFHGADTLWQYATQMGTSSGYNDNSTSETCNEFNMLKLTRLLFQVTKEVKYSEYYEYTFTNSILAQQNPETGMVTYFQPQQAGFAKVFSTPGTKLLAPDSTNFYGTELGEFWCDQGTGVENFAKLSDSVFFTDKNDIYVNMFYSASISYAANNVKLTQTANVPKQETVTYRVDAIDGGAVAAGTSLKLRVPTWVKTAPTLTKNGVAIDATATDGWITVPVAAGDTIAYTLVPAVKDIDAADNANWVAFQYGPVLLAAALSDKNVGSWYYAGILVRMSTWDADAAKKAEILLGEGSDVATWKANIASNLVRTDSPDDGGDIAFSLKGDGGEDTGLDFTSYYKMYKYRYATYITLAGLDSDAFQSKVISDKEQLRDALRTTDALTSFDANNSEADKNYDASADSTVSEYNGATYRTASGSGWFSYQMIVNKSAAKNYLAVRYNTADAGNSFAVTVDGTLLKTEQITTDPSADANGFYSVYYELPSDVVAAATQKRDKAGNLVTDAESNPVYAATVRFSGTGASPVGRVFGVSTVTTTAYDTNSLLSSLSFGAGSLDKQFYPKVREYTLTVAADATSVDMSVAPASAAGYVSVNGIVIDDSLTRTVPLDGPSTTLNVVSYAEDHSTSTEYSVKILKEGTPAATTPVLHYTFDGDSSAGSGATVGDSGTRGLAGTIVNGGASLISGDGISGHALRLTGSGGSNPYVTIPGGLIAEGQDDVTITARFRWTDTAKGTYHRIFDIGQSNAQYLFATPNNGSVTYAELKSGGKTVTLKNSVSLSPNVWYDVAVVLEGGQRVTYYIDGVAVASEQTTLTAAGIIGSSSLSGYLGKSFYSSDAYMKGDIDDFAVYDRALSDLDLAGYSPTPVSSIVVSPASSIPVGGTTALVATASPADATVPDVRWSSSDPTVATVSNTGLVTALAAGTVTVTATSVDGSGVSGSVSLTVTPGTLSSATPVITGAARVGEALSADPGSWAPAPVSLSYQWYADSVAIAGATERTFTVTAAETGKRISVQVTGSREGYLASSVTSIQTEPVAAVSSPIVTGSTPVIAGTAQVGKLLTAKTGSWAPDGVRLRYQWYANGAAVRGATGSSLRLGAGLVGKRITVQVTGTKDGYGASSRLSSSTSKVRTGALKTSSVTVKGRAVIGATLRASTKKWSPSPVKLTYRWYRDGKRITGAVKSSYKVTGSDRGAKLSVTVTGKKGGYSTASRSSKRTATVKR